MNAGLPTTGIGGIFYFLCSFLMLGIELFLTIRRRSSLHRWKIVIRQLSITLGILISIYLTGLVLRLIIPQSIAIAITGLAGNKTLSQNSSTLLFTPFIILASLLILTQFLRIYYRLTAKTPTQEFK